ncbi:11078_t:CDS:1, partial [Racocetra fulgida]
WQYSYWTDNIPAIADLGISKPIDASSNEIAIFEVIPYVAPEDIYSF